MIKFWEWAFAKMENISLVDSICFCCSKQVVVFNHATNAVFSLREFMVWQCCCIFRLKSWAWMSSDACNSFLMLWIIPCTWVIDDKIEDVTNLIWCKFSVEELVNNDSPEIAWNNSKQDRSMLEENFTINIPIAECESWNNRSSPSAVMLCEDVITDENERRRVWSSDARAWSGDSTVHGTKEML